MGVHELLKAAERFRDAAEQADRAWAQISKHGNYDTAKLSMQSSLSQGNVAMQMMQQWLGALTPAPEQPQPVASKDALTLVPKSEPQPDGDGGE